jgi:agmatinase
MIIQVPGINGLSNTKGCEKAPQAICNYLNVESEKWELDNENLDFQQNQILQKSKQIFLSENSQKIIFIGGDHSISFPIIKSFLKKYSDSLILIFDAHFDLMHPLKNPTHEEWLRALIQEKPNANILLIGPRKNSSNTDKQELDFAKKHKINFIYSDEFNERKQEILNLSKGKKIYLSFDIDVLDNSLISATSYPEKNGLFISQIQEILNLLKENIVALDLVEYNPSLDKNKSDLEKISNILKILIK